MVENKLEEKMEHQREAGVLEWLLFEGPCILTSPREVVLRGT